MNQYLQILLTFLAVSVSSKGTTITSKACDATIYFDQINLLSTNPASEEQIKLADNGDDPCVKTGSDEYESKRVFSLKTDGGDDFTITVITQQNKFELKNIIYQDKTFRPRQNWKIANSYTLAPSGALGSTFLCDFTTYSYVTTKDVNNVQSLTFDKLCDSNDETCKKKASDLF